MVTHDGARCLLVEQPAAAGPGSVHARLRLPAEELRGTRVKVEARIKANYANLPESARRIADLILEWRGGLPIKLGDVATVDYGPPQRDGFIYHNGRAAARFTIHKTNDANVLEALEGVKAFMDELNETEFKDRNLLAAYSFDPSVYIKRCFTPSSASRTLASLVLAIENRAAERPL